MILSNEQDRQLVEKMFPDIAQDAYLVTSIGKLYRLTGNLIQNSSDNIPLGKIDAADMDIIVNSFKSFVMTVITVCRKYKKNG